MKTFPDDVALTFFQRVSARRIAERMCPGIWNEEATRRENCVRTLRYVMVNGKQDEFMKALTEPHEINIDGKVTDLNKEYHYPVREDIQYIEDHNLMKEATYWFHINNRIRRTLIFIDRNGKVNSERLDYGTPNYGHGAKVVMYQKIYGIIEAVSDTYSKYITKPEEVADTIAYHPIDVSLMNTSTL